MIINIIFGFANSITTFIVFMFFNGLVQASGWPGTVGGAAQWIRRKERGVVMGFWSTNYLVGNVMVKMLGGFLLGMSGWRYAFWGATVAAFVIWWLLYFWQRTKPEDVGLDPIVGQDADSEREVKASLEERLSFRKYSKLTIKSNCSVDGSELFLY